MRGPMIALKFKPNDRRPAYRCAVVVSRRVHKSAVARNRIRRRVYEQVRSHAKQLASPYDMVFTVFDERIKDMPSQELATDIQALLHQAHIIGTPVDKENVMIRKQEK